MNEIYQKKTEFGTVRLPAVLSLPPFSPRFPLPSFFQAPLRLRGLLVFSLVHCFSSMRSSERAFFVVSKRDSKGVRPRIPKFFFLSKKKERKKRKNAVLRRRGYKTSISARK